MTALQEFEELASMIMGGAKEAKTQREAIIATQMMYDLKAVFFPKFSQATIGRNDLVMKDYCPLCQLYLENTVSHSECPLYEKHTPSSCCTEWYEMAFAEEDRRGFTYWFRKLHERIDSL